MDPSQVFSMRVDDREASSPVLAALRRHPEFRIQVERLPVGDYLIDDSLLFERKTLMDLVRPRSRTGVFSHRPNGWRMPGRAVR
jgi:DNA excision repair protein ERCC-4